MPGTRKLGRSTAHRTAMLRGLVTFFLENGKIEDHRHPCQRGALAGGKDDHHCQRQQPCRTSAW